MTKKKSNRKAPQRKTASRPSKQALLEAKASRVWMNRLNGAVTFLRQLSALPTSHKDVWAKGTWEYYMKQAHALLEHPPKGAEKYATKVKRELKRLSL